MGRTAPNKRTGNYSVPAHSRGTRSAATVVRRIQPPSPESANFPSASPSRCSSSSTPSATSSPLVRQSENISPVAGFSSVCIPTVPTTPAVAGVVRSGQQRRVVTERDILAPIRLHYTQNSDEEATNTSNVEVVEPRVVEGECQGVGPIAAQLKEFMAQQIAFNSQLLQAVKENPKDDNQDINQRKKNRKLPKTLTVSL